MILAAMLLVALEDPAAVKQDAKCAAVMLAVRDSVAEGATEGAAASAAAAYYVGKLEGYYATVPPMAFAPISPFELTRNAILDADRNLRKLDEASIRPMAKACFEAYQSAMRV